LPAQQSSMPSCRTPCRLQDIRRGLQGMGSTAHGLAAAVAVRAQCNMALGVPPKTAGMYAAHLDACSAACFAAAGASVAPALPCMVVKARVSMQRRSCSSMLPVYSAVACPLCVAAVALLWSQVVVCAHSMVADVSQPVRASSLGTKCAMLCRCPVQAQGRCFPAVSADRLCAQHDGSSCT
jgi:hypothetical protein